MTIKEFSLVQSEKQTRRTLSGLSFLKSGFQFLKQIKGFRPSCMHLLLSSTGAGKSTLVRSIIMDYQTFNPGKRVLLFLSEESYDDLKNEIAKTDFNFERANGFFVFSEMDDYKTPQKFFRYLKTIIIEEGIEFFIFDNITTSRMYNDMSPKDQSTFISKLKMIIKETNCATLLIAHTGANVFDNANRIINENDVRGSKSIVNIMEFIFILQRFSVEDRFCTTLRIAKHRNQNPENSFYLLGFNTETKHYDLDRPTNFKEFKEIFSLRDKL